MDKLLEVMDRDFNGMSFLNLVDFDALYGHRRDPEGYSNALKAFDDHLPEIKTSFPMFSFFDGSFPLHP